MEMLKVEVDRQRWLRGDPTYSRLLNIQGKMCCLGFVVEKLGFAPEEFRYIAVPSGLCYGAGKSKQPLLEEIGLVEVDDNIILDTQICCDLMEANDKVSLNVGIGGNLTLDYKFEQDRESRIKELGKQINIDFTFVN